ncbi:MAG: L,D-transpeptidase, partial [Nitrospirota bacterium]
MINAMILRNAVWFLIFVFACLGMAVLCYGTKINPCEGYKTAVLVDTKQHKMWLCQEDKPVGEYKVAIGKGGINKIK